MSSGGNSLALALGVGGGLFLSYYLRDRHVPLLGTNEVGTPPGGAHVPEAPPRLAGTCSLRLDSKGLTADGQRVDVSGAVARCKAAGKADLVFAKNGPAAVYVQLNQALARAHVPVTVREG